MTIDIASRMLRHALRALTVIVVLFAALFVMTLVTGARAESKHVAEVVRLVNAERAKAGMSAVELHTDLIAAADRRAQEASMKFSHTRPDGSEWKTVFVEFDIDCSHRGENLAEGYKSPRAVVKAWMASEGHRKNILNAEFDHIAVGISEKDGVLYWSQLFVCTTKTISLSASVCVAGKDLNVRVAATAKSDVLAVAAEGSTVNVLEISGSWARVQMTDGTEGWTSSKHLIA